MNLIKIIFRKINLYIIILNLIFFISFKKKKEFIHKNYKINKFIIDKIYFINLNIKKINNILFY